MTTTINADPDVSGPDKIDVYGEADQLEKRSLQQVVIFEQSNSIIMQYSAAD